MFSLFSLSPFLVDLFRRQPFAQLGHNILQLDGLGHQIIHPAADKHLPGALHSICRQGKDGNLAVYSGQIPDNPGGLHSIHLRHHMIHKNQIILFVRDLEDCLPSAQSRVYMHLQRTQKPFRHGQVDRVVIHHQDFRIRGDKVKFVRVKNVKIALRLISL